MDNDFMHNIELDVLKLESTRDLIATTIRMIESKRIVVDDDSIKLRIATIHFFSEQMDYNRTFIEAVELYSTVMNKCQ